MSQTQIQTPAITNGSVTTVKLANDAVTAGKIATGAVGTTEIANNAVTTGKIATGAISFDKMGTGSVSILHESNAGTNTIQINLGLGTWFVEFYYTTHVFALNRIMNMYIDNLSVQTVPILGDYQGTFYVPMFGAHYVTGNRTITCFIDGALADPNSSVQRCMVKATRIY